MDELEKGLDLGMTGARRDEALRRFAALVEEWGLRMPGVEPLVLDFGLDDFARFGLIEYWIANEGAAGYCGKFLFVFDGQTCPEHYHRDKLETFYVVRGEVEMEYDGAIRTLRAGDTLRVERGKAHRFTGRGPALLLEVSRPSIIDDNYFADSRVPYGGNYRR